MLEASKNLNLSLAGTGFPPRLEYLSLAENDLLPAQFIGVSLAASGSLVHLNMSWNQFPSLAGVAVLTSLRCALGPLDGAYVQGAV